ncbi:MAG: MMPL family transporter [Deltaproteobacteria bacterium]|nr:MMPL family transporter [Deltaproteobacteria bacterium]
MTASPEQQHPEQQQQPSLPPPNRAPRWLIAYLRWVLGHRLWVIGLLLFVSALAAMSVSQGVLSTALAKLFFADNPRYDRHQALSKRFANDEIVAVALDEPQLATPEVFRRLHRLTVKLEKLPWVRRVQAISDLQRIRNEGDTLTTRAYHELATRSKDAAQRALKEIRQDPLYGRVFVSADGRTTALLIEPKVDPDRPVELWESNFELLYDAFASEGFGRERLYIAGGPAHLHQMIRSSRTNLLTLFPLVALVLMILVFGLFRGLWPMVVTMATALISVLWTMGLSIAMDPKISVLISVVPAVMLVVAVSDNIHIASAYLLELRAGRPKKEALLVSGAEVGLACLYTSLTTLLGFASLAFMPAPLIRHMALILAFGVSVALLISVTLTPILLSWMKTPRPRPAERRLLLQLVDGISKASSRVSHAWPRAVVLFFAVLLGLAAWGASKVTVETDLSKRYPAHTPLRVAERFVSEKLAGVNFIDLYLEAPNPGDVLDPRIFSAVSELQQRMVRHESVDATLSVVDLVRSMHRQLAPPSLREKLPPSREANEQYVLLFESAGGRHLTRFLDFERRRLRISLQLNGYGVRHTARIGHEAERLARELLPAGIKVEVSGLSLLLGDWLEEVIRGQRQGLLFAFLTIALVISLALFSWRDGLLAMLPNAAPLVLLGGVLGWFWPVVDSDTMMVAIIAIGIAVDDTIHFLTRLRIEKMTTSHAEALERTFAFSGRAIVMTTLLLALGFIPLAAGTYYTVQMMGTLLPFTLLCALATDLLLLPAMVRLGWFKLDAAPLVPDSARE